MQGSDRELTEEYVAGRVAVLNNKCGPDAQTSSSHSPFCPPESRLVPRESVSTSKNTKEQKQKRSKSLKSRRNAVLHNGLPIWKSLVIEPDAVEFKVRNGRSWRKRMFQIHFDETT